MINATNKPLKVNNQSKKFLPPVGYSLNYMTYLMVDDLVY